MQIIQTYQTKGLKTPTDVALYVAAMNNATVGTKRICNNPEHVAPFKILSDILLDAVQYYVIWGSRSGSKTYLFGGLCTWYKSVAKKQYETKILGGSEGQSLLSYRALQDFSKVGDPDNVLVKRLLTSKGEFKDGSSVSILKASSKSVRGPHPQNLLLDEVDEIDPQVYEDALSQPQSKYGHPASLGMFSTNHNVNGQMDAALARAADKGHAVYKYCVWETMEGCKDYSCSTCPLSSLCPGKAMKGADGYYKIEDFVEKLNTLSFSTLSRDWLCIKTGMGDTVFEQEWDENIHVVSVPLREEPVVLSLDWGGTDPFSAGVWQRAPQDSPNFDKDAWIRVTELYLNSTHESATNPKFIRMAKTKPWWRLIKEVVPDNSRPDLIEEWRKALPRARFLTQEKKTIDEGIEAMKDALSPVLGSPKILVNRICTNMRREMQLYKINPRTGNPIDKDNHTVDETRYFVLAKIRRGETGSFTVIDSNVMPR